MNRCPLTYEICEGRYSPAGLRRFSRRLTDLADLPFSSDELRREAAARADKMSIQGVQPKLSARLDTHTQRFEPIDHGGTFILKPQGADYPEVPENEDLTMRLAARAGIEVPLHGLIYGRDGALTYVIRRFDRSPRGVKIHAEDFAQLSGRGRETKYRATMEQVAALVEQYCTFPAVEKVKLFRLTLFSFLVGNEDLHLKNLSLLEEPDLVRLSPAYDLVNTSIVLAEPAEELALPLRGKKNRLSADDLVEYFGGERLGLNARTIRRVLGDLAKSQGDWEGLLEASFLSPGAKQKYRAVLQERVARLFG